MGYQFSILCYIRFLSGLLAILLAFFLWKKRKSQGALFLMIFEIMAAVWAISDGMEAAAASISQKMFWAQIAYIGIPNSAVMFLMFSLSYTRDYTFRKNRLLYLLLVIPLITIALAFTSTRHHLLWSNIILLPETGQAVYYYGPWFWVNVSYQYSLLVLGMFVLIAGAFRVYTIHRIQTWLLLLSVLLPFTASILYIFKLMPVKGIDMTPVAFIFSGIIIGFSLYRLDFFNIIPIAHRQTIDNLDDGIAVLDSRERVMNINPAFTRVTGMKPSEVNGRGIESILAFFGLKPYDLSAETEFKAEAGVERGGDQKYFELKLQPVTDTNGKQVGSLLIIRDNTLNKQILDAVAESSLRRKKELAEKEKLIMDLDAYARMVAHDLKNPLGAITSFSYLIQDALKTNKISDATEMIDMLQGEANKMNRIIDDLLLLSRIRQEDIRNVPVDIKAIIDEAINRQHNLIARKNAEIEMPEKWPVVYGHTQWVEQVWINLINNALKYGGNPPEIKIGYTKESPSAVRFWIKDNGKGLPPALLERLFNDFERLGNKDTEGTGLGLSIVRRLINKMGGVISAVSTNKPGEGCTFSFTLMSEKKNT